MSLKDFPTRADGSWKLSLGEKRIKQTCGFETASRIQKQNLEASGEKSQIKKPPKSSLNTDRVNRETRRYPGTCKFHRKNEIRSKTPRTPSSANLGR